MKLHPQNPTPGESSPVALPTPVELREVVEVLDLILDGLNRTQTSYYYAGAKNRLKSIKERLT